MPATAAAVTAVAGEAQRKTHAILLFQEQGVVVVDRHYHHGGEKKELVAKEIIKLDAVVGEFVGTT